MDKLKELRDEACIKKLQAENENLRGALERSPCPFPDHTDHTNVKACIDADKCGCENVLVLNGN